MRGLLPRVATGAGLVVLGGATALCAVAVHQLWWGWLLGVLATAVVLVRLPAGLHLRTAYAAGWVVTLGLVVLGRPEGDYAVAADLAGYGLVAAGLVVLGYGIATVPMRPVRRPPVRPADESRGGS